MTNNNQWRKKFLEEIQHGLNARRQGKEGMARVCARRAAGLVIDEYLRRQVDEQSDTLSSELEPANSVVQPEQTRISAGKKRETLSAYDLLRLLGSLPDVPVEAVQIAELLLLRVTPQYTLPVEIDLLAQAQRLALILLAFNSKQPGDTPG